ncbi:MAG: universal stress protein [Actinobacteria bacterium]|nr:universal stress protein [Actinomycetota bacterium]
MIVRRILIAVDGTESSTRGVEAGVELAARYHAELVLVTAVSVPQHVVKAARVDGLEDYVERMGQEGLSAALGVLRRRRVGAEVKIAVGPSAETIVAEASLPGIDLVVMDRRGRTEPKDIVLGSISDRVVRNIAIPILLIP